MKKIAFIMVSVFLFVLYPLKAQENAKQLIEDFFKISGNWQGSLTYLDYSSGKPYTMPANLEVKRINDSNEFAFINTYPNEKSANSTQTIVISKDGKYIGKEEVVSRTELQDGTIEIAVQKQGKDGNDNKEALIRLTYTIGKNDFSIRKEVLFSGEDKWIKRHEYVYTKK